MKTIDLLSGDQLACAPLVTKRASKPSRFIIQTSGKPPRSVVYMIRLPSGDQRGSASGSGPWVSCVRSLPLACIRQIFMVPPRSLTKTIVPLRLATSIFPESGVGVTTGTGLPDDGETSEVLRLSATTALLVSPA